MICDDHLPARNTDVALITGHEIVATIAQIHLHPNVRQKLCDILPAQAKCHLAPVAAWADQVKWHYPGSAGMHYVNRTSFVFRLQPARSARPARHLQPARQSGLRR